MENKRLAGIFGMLSGPLNISPDNWASAANGKSYELLTDLARIQVDLDQSGLRDSEKIGCPALFPKPDCTGPA